MAVKIEFKGIQGVISSVRKYPERVTKQIHEELQDWANRTEGQAQISVPVDTGALKGTIRAVLGADKLTWIVKAGGINNVNYAPYVEFGTGTGVDQAFLQEFGLVSYARNFMGASQDRVHIPMNSYLYRNARIEFEKSVININEIIRKAWDR